MLEEKLQIIASLDYAWTVLNNIDIKSRIWQIAEGNINSKDKTLCILMANVILNTKYLKDIEEEEKDNIRE